MFGIRVLIYLLGIALVIWILIRLAKTPRVEKKSAKRVGDMVRCAHCGIYVPRHEAIQDSDRYYCCTRHRDEDRKR
ncbi:MAG: PP0621 family protein [Pseudomonadota bacterium]|nr:PP0621 family protein [Pseudomonadota bacterium]